MGFPFPPSNHGGVLFPLISRFIYETCPPVGNVCTAFMAGLICGPPQRGREAASSRSEQTGNYLLSRATLQPTDPESTDAFRNFISSSNIVTHLGFRCSALQIPGFIFSSRLEKSMFLTASVGNLGTKSSLKVQRGLG